MHISPHSSRHTAGSLLQRRLRAAWRPLGLFIFALFTFLGGLLCGQIEPDSPISGFSLVLFNENNGHRAWTVKGSEARYLDASTFDIRELEVAVYGRREPFLGVVENTIMSSQATLYRDRKYAESQEDILAVGPNFIIRGEDWRWDAESERLEIDSSVKVILNHNFGPVLE